MRRIFINAKRLEEKAPANDYLKKRLKMPEYCGHNLDALYDVLSSMGRETVIYLMQCSEGKTKYANQIIETMKEAAEANEKLQVIELS